MIKCLALALEKAQSVYIPRATVSITPKAEGGASPSKDLVNKYNPFNKRHLKRETSQGRATLGSPSVDSTGAEQALDSSRKNNKNKWFK